MSLANMSSSLVIPLFTLALLAALAAGKKALGFLLVRLRLLRLPKYPGYEPLLGHLRSVPSDANDFFRWCAKNTSEVSKTAKIAVIWLGMSPMIFVNHPDSAEVLLKSTKHLRKSSNYNMIRPWIKDGLAMSEGKKWHSRRKLLTGSFHFEILSEFLVVMNEHAAVLANSVAAIVAGGSRLDLAKLLKLCTLDIICETAMGCKVNAQLDGENRYVTAVHRMADFCQIRLTNPLLMNDFFFSLSKHAAQQKETLETLHSFSGEVIKKKLLESASSGGGQPASSKRKALLDLLIAAKTEDGASLTADDIQEEVDTFMFAGHDTSSITLMWGIYLLGRNPEKQQKLHDELDAVFGGDRDCDVTVEHLKELPYLDMVVKEVLRLYPPGSFIGRELVEDLEIDGWTVPAGEDINVFIYNIHRHPDIWEDPHEFLPERFESGARLQSKRSAYAYIPFSAGPRNCIGQRFAVQEQKVILAKLFRRFTIVANDREEDIKVHCGLVLEMNQELNLDVKVR